MARIYIPGAQFPSNCRECKLCKPYGCVGDCYCMWLGEYFTNNVKPPYKERPDECPLIPVPEHGRLIDADALEYHADNVRDPMGRTEKTVMWKKIEAAPTIIPGDKETQP